MYSQFREENEKPKKSHRHRNTPSFSSSLLDEICRSIDDKPEPGFRAKTKRDDETRSRLVEKWMENDKTVFRRRPIQCVFPDNDVDFRPKPVRTDRERQRDSYLFDDYERIINREKIMKSSPKSRALKFYDNLKKPISPGARLTTFINSIFNRRKSKPINPKPRDSNSINDNDIDDDRHRHRHRKTAATITKIISDQHRRNININNIVIGRPPLPTRCSFDQDEDEDALSESSSDLFELDHLSFGHKDDIMFSELPVYETTVFHNNRRFNLKN